MVKKILDTGGLAIHKNLNFYTKNLLYVDSSVKPAYVGTKAFCKSKGSGLLYLYIFGSYSARGSGSGSPFPLLT
jgi:hypothetical protein